ncbi:MAG: hypothetical protein R3D44_01280 [Hyphomicrobiaceae bacterium]
MRCVSRFGSEGLATLAVVLVLALGLGTADRAAAQGADSILGRNIDVSRGRAADNPRSVGDQAVVNGWPLYRTERGQAAYNAAMATLAATHSAAPKAAVFKGCANLLCEIDVPRIASDGWVPAGRIWISSSEYLVVAHSPRMRGSRAMRRRPLRSMRYFVFHEFNNSSRNTDPYDTISSHSGRVFVPFYMSKTGTDAVGHHFVVIVQVAPYDVISVHATNYGSAGPGVEVAKNMGDDLEPLQGRAGIVLAEIVKRAAPQLRVVNHRGREGLPMLEGYQSRLGALRRGRGGEALRLPFVPARSDRVATAQAGLGELIMRPGASRRLSIAERTFVPLGGASKAREPKEGATADAPRLVVPVRLARRPEAEGAPRPVLKGPVRLVRSSVFTPSTGP